MSNTSNCVTWKGVYALMGSAIAVSTIIIWSLLILHSAHPHSGAVSRVEFELLREDIGRLEDKVDRLIERRD